MTMNQRRAEWAYRALLVHMQYTGSEGENAEIGMTDLLANLMHLSDESGYDFDAALARARDHHAHEVAYPDEDRAETQHALYGRL